MVGGLKVETAETNKNFMLCFL